MSSSKYLITIDDTIVLVYSQGQALIRFNMIRYYSVVANFLDHPVHTENFSVKKLGRIEVERFIGSGHHRALWYSTTWSNSIIVKC